LMWDADRGAFVDFDWRSKQRSSDLTAATVYPLFVGSPEHAHELATTVRKSLLMAHGLATTLQVTGQQWDAPNGWAPLQWIAIAGLRRQDEPGLAAGVPARGGAENRRVYCRTGKLVEKYDVRDAGEGAGGEYPVQDGFGWTN